MRNSVLRSSAILVAAVAASLSAGGCTRTGGVKGKVLHVVFEDNVKTTDPASEYDTISGEVVGQIYETPYQYDYFSERPVLIPKLADGMPTLSKDRLTYTFRLKKGVRFQDDPCFKESGGRGRELKAADFIYGWKRLANVANEPQGFWVFESKVAGVNEFQKKFGAGRPDAEIMGDEIEGFKALDDHTIQIKLLKPYPQLTYALTTAFAAPVAREAIEYYGKDFERHPVGTGPFRMLSYQPASQIIMVRNENFRDERFPAPEAVAPRYRDIAREYAGRRLPLVDAIQFDILKEEQPRWLGFLSGRYDEIKIPKDNFNTIIDHGRIKPEWAAKGIGLSIEPAIAYYYVSINMLDPVLGTNKYLRQAIASAIDSKTWLELFKNNRGSLQTEVSPPMVAERCGKPYRWTFNIERAKALLAKAGYPGGKGLEPLRWDTRRTEMSERQVAELIQKNLAKIGVQLEVISNTFPAYLDKTHKGNLMLSKGGFSMDYPDPENNYQQLYGPNKAPGPNDANFDNPRFNALFEKMATMSPSPARTQLICEMEDLLQEEVPWAYSHYEDEYRLVQKRLRNYHASELIYEKYKYVDVVDEKAPAVAKLN